MIVGSSNISKQIRSSTQDDIIKSPNPMSKTVNASATAASTSPSKLSAFHSPTHSVLTSDSDNYSQRNAAKEPYKYNAQRKPSPINPEPAKITSIAHSLELCKPLYINTEDKLILTHSLSSFSPESVDSDYDFPFPNSPDTLTTPNNEISSLLESSEISNNEIISPATHSRILSNRQILPQFDRESPASSVASSSGISSNAPRRFTKKLKRASSPDKIEESFLKLTSVVSSHLESKPQNVMSFDVTDEDDIFAKSVACQLRKISEPKKSGIKGQIMKILYKL